MNDQEENSFPRMKRGEVVDLVQVVLADVGIAESTVYEARSRPSGADSPHPAIAPSAARPVLDEDVLAEGLRERRRD